MNRRRTLTSLTTAGGLAVLLIAGACSPSTSTATSASTTTEAARPGATAGTRPTGGTGTTERGPGSSTSTRVSKLRRLKGSRLKLPMSVSRPSMTTTSSG